MFSNYKVKIDSIDTEYKTLSVLIEWVKVNELGEISTGRTRRGFVPGTSPADVETFLNDTAPGANYQDTVDTMNSLWTPEVVTKYQASVNEQ